MTTKLTTTGITFNDGLSLTTAPTLTISTSGYGVSYVANNNNGTGNVQFKILVAGTLGTASITSAANVVTLNGI